MNRYRKGADSMAAQVDNYKCLACGGPIEFSSATGKLECEYCGSSYEVEEMEAHFNQKHESATTGASDTSSLNEAWGADGENMRIYSCPSCRAELICDQTTAATSCPYCGNPTVIPGQFEGVMKPDLVIPFKLDKDAAVKALKEHYKGKVFLPSAFSKENHINEIKGVYVPFWLFDSKAEASVDFLATKSSTRREGDYEVTTTRHFAVHRGGTVSFEKIPVDASTKMPDEYMDAIEPFDYGELKPFKAAYLPGYLADKYDVSAEECSKRADERASNSAYEAIATSVVGYHTCTAVKKDIQMKKEQVKYAMLPVWLLHTKWNGQDYLFAMNGQTGKMIGKLPVSKGKFMAWFSGIAVAASLISAMVLSWFW